uniref:Uncharacterized protein n=1 Tax=Anguilla anguilla TaxID=7936 RepID=A0A0E9QNL8_ANGAN
MITYIHTVYMYICVYNSCLLTGSGDEWPF